MRHFFVLIIILAFSLATVQARAADSAPAEAAVSESREAPVKPAEGPPSAENGAAPTTVETGAAPAPGSVAEAKLSRVTSVALEHTGVETLGVKAALALKSALNENSLFELTEEEKPKLKILLFTQTEFPSRPGVGSLYSVIWVYSESSRVFPTFLEQEQGVITAEYLEDIVTEILRKTDGLAARYSYIFHPAP